MLNVNARNMGNLAVLRLQGRIVNGETAELCSAMQSLSGIRAVVLDLAQVSTVDARGLGLMLELREQAQSKGISFKVMNVPRLVGEVLEVTRLNSVFEVMSGVEFFPAAVPGRPRTAVPALASCAWR